VPQRGVGVGAEEVVGVFTGGEVDGDDEGGLLSGTGRLTQGAADGLDCVNGTVLGVGKDDSVDGGDVDALPQHAGIGEHSGGVGGGVGGELQQQAAADLRSVVAADPVRPQIGGPQLSGEGGGGVGQGGGKRAGVGDAVVEGEDTAQPVVVDGAQGGDLAAGQA
jgi:hypothetical protein